MERFRVCGVDRAKLQGRDAVKAVPIVLLSGRVESGHPKDANKWVSRLQYTIYFESNSHRNGRTSDLLPV